MIYLVCIYFLFYFDFARFENVDCLFFFSFIFFQIGEIENGVLETPRTTITTATNQFENEIQNEFQNLNLRMLFVF